MRNIQELLHLWMTQVGCVRYEQIKDVCEYLNIKYALGLERPMHKIFYPLLYSGVVDLVNDGRYQITPMCIILRSKQKTIVSNPVDKDKLIQTSFVGIYTTNNNQFANSEQSYSFNAEAILKEFPTIKDVVGDFELKHDYNPSEFSSGIGLQKKTSNSIFSYFIDTNSRCYKVPLNSSNPDAYNIAYCYDRVIAGISNGEYNSAIKSLKLKLPHIPILIYRVLMLESLFNEREPLVEAGSYTFYNVNQKLHKELNRIFCGTITSNIDE
jgi:hypothetical protein